jgi:hypothetical protein
MRQLTESPVQSAPEAATVTVTAITHATANQAANVTQAGLASGALHAPTGLGCHRSALLLKGN